MRPTIIAGNWKMNTSISEALTMVDEILAKTNTTTSNVIIIPPFTHLNVLHNKLKNTAISLGAQTISAHENGAYTGEISAKMIIETGCQYVLVGHSERRQYHHEDNLLLNKQIQQALSQKITVIYCVGETLTERNNQQTFDVINSQLKEGLKDISVTSGELLIAYEPVWAIGTGQVATPDQAQEVHHYIRTQLASLLTPQLADTCPILYGGSVNPKNSSGLFAQPDIDGGLVGGASLDASSFCSIINDND